MNCRQCQEELSAYLEGLLEQSKVQQLESHLDDCSECRAEFEAARQITDRLTRDGRISTNASMEIPVIDRVLREQSIQLRRFEMQRRSRWIQAGGAVTAAAVVIALTVLWSARPGRMLSAAEVKLGAAAVMARGAECLPEITSIHICAKMRTAPGGNFGDIDAEGALVPVEVWREFGDKNKWRFEKPGRTVVMDGTFQTTFIEPEYVHRAAKVAGDYADRHWLLRLAAVQETIGDELRTALAKGWDLTLTHDRDKKNEGTATVVIETQSGLKDGDWVKNKVLGESDTRRVYRFDRESGRLEGFEIYLHEKKGRDTLVFEVTGIEYNQPIDPKVFTLELPDGVVFSEVPKELADNKKYAQMTPEEAARAYFEACANEDWDEYRNFNTTPATDRIKEILGGLEVLSVGKAFRSGRYAGWYVPYEIKFKSGQIKKFNLALRKDNPAKRFIVDGGI